MRFIRKQGNGPFQLNESHSNPPSTPATATSRWSRFGHKAQVLRSLLEEQYGLCCYSEIRPDQVGLGFHIEHVENKSQAPQKTFDYSNLAASALDSQNDLHALKVHQAELFGGHAIGKSNSVDARLFLSCHHLNCAHFFTYLSDGRVVPSDGLVAVDEQKARYTIDLLNLNSPYLQDMRQRWWEELAAIIDDHIDEDMSLHCLAGIDLLPIDGRLSPFFSITRQIFGIVAKDVLTGGGFN